MIASAVDAVTGLGGILGLFIGIAVIVGIIFLIILTILMPYYVYKIFRQADITNKLLRQMIRSSGHEPEA